jgi:hypothetical protein
VPRPTTSGRVAANLRAARKLGQVTREEIKARKAQAKADRAKAEADAEAAWQAELLAKQTGQAARKELAAELVQARKDDPAKVAEIIERFEAKLPEAKRSVPQPDYVATINRIDGTITRTPLPAVTVTPAADDPAPASRNPDMPVWIREGRNATRAEWLAHQRMRNPRVGVAVNSWHQIYDQGSGAGEVSGHAGIRVPHNDSSRDGWRHGGPHWRQKL